VCTAWRAYFSGSSFQSSRSGWGVRLVIHVLHDGYHVRIAPHLHKKLLSSPKNYLSGEQKSLVDWLAKRAAGFRIVSLISTGDKGYRTVSLLLALYKSDRSNSFGPELSLNTGNCTTPQGLLIIRSHLAFYPEHKYCSLLSCRKLLLAEGTCHLSAHNRHTYPAEMQCQCGRLGSAEPCHLRKAEILALSRCS